MRAVVITEYGSTDVLKVEDLPAPVLGSNEVRVFVETARLSNAGSAVRLRIVRGIRTSRLLSILRNESPSKVGR